MSGALKPSPELESRLIDGEVAVCTKVGLLFGVGRECVDNLGLGLALLGGATFSRSSCFRFPTVVCVGLRWFIYCMVECESISIDAERYCDRLENEWFTRVRSVG